ncbi:hypothetical protein [Aeromonas caviae]|uniref:hypothetical protein n=1 Tax=Aeromonas caviae TaxID=648 RepID=UPI0011195DE0|nr:hypothetical protein [Aeromonas caviae]
MKIKFIFTLYIIALFGCAKPEPATFSNYYVNNAGDASLLMTLECSDYINAVNCKERQDEVLPLVRLSVQKLSEKNEFKASCVFNELTSSSNIETKFYDYVHSNKLTEDGTVYALLLWFDELYRSSYHLTPASNRCLVYATLVRTSFGINFRPFLNML